LFPVATRISGLAQRWRHCVPKQTVQAGASANSASVPSGQSACSGAEPQSKSTRFQYETDIVNFTHQVTGSVHTGTLLVPNPTPASGDETDDA
jgi:hypothetical protein